MSQPIKARHIASKKKKKPERKYPSFINTGYIFKIKRTEKNCPRVLTLWLQSALNWEVKSAILQTRAMTEQQSADNLTNALSTTASQPSLGCGCRARTMWSCFKCPSLIHRHRSCIFYSVALTRPTAHTHWHACRNAQTQNMWSSHSCPQRQRQRQEPAVLEVCCRRPHRPPAGLYF